MRALEVYLNGRKLCVAGFGNHLSISATVGFVNDLPCELAVFASVGPNGDFAKWLDRELNVGDDVTVKVVLADQVDEPKSVQTKKRT